jgi:hypothetical protein
LPPHTLLEPLSDKSLIVRVLAPFLRRAWIFVGLHRKSRGRARRRGPASIAALRASRFTCSEMSLHFNDIRNLRRLESILFIPSMVSA